MIKFGIMIAFAGIIFVIAGVAQAAQNRSYAACSELVTGTIIRKHSRSLKGSKAYLLTVSYMVNDIPYEKVVGALLTEYNDAKLGDKLQLLYKPNNPKKSVRPDMFTTDKQRIILITGLILLIMGLALLFIGRI